MPDGYPSWNFTIGKEISYVNGRLDHVIAIGVLLATTQKRKALKQLYSIFLIIIHYIWLFFKNGFFLRYVHITLYVNGYI